MEHTRTTMPPDEHTRRNPTVAEDRQVIAEHYRAEARRQDTEDARARWLGYQSEGDFTDRAAAYLERHPTLSRDLVRHGGFIYFGKDRQR